MIKYVTMLTLLTSLTASTDPAIPDDSALPPVSSPHNSPALTSSYTAEEMGPLYELVNAYAAQKREEDRQFIECMLTYVLIPPPVDPDREEADRIIAEGIRAAVAEEDERIRLLGELVNAYAASRGAPK